jgi:mRNA-degrading endonuclease RelE of RelBE toxin-antitoxin system
MFRVEFCETANRQLKKIAQRNSAIARDIKTKIGWLAENAEAIRHEKMHDHAEQSLHSGQYRILYSVDWKNHLIAVEDVDKHDAAYRKLKRR